MATGPKCVSAEWTLDVAQGQAVVVEKVVSVFTSHDAEFKDAEGQGGDRDARLKRLAMQELEDVTYFSQLLDPHRRVWLDIWDKSDILVDGDRFVQTMIRAHTYHLLITSSHHREKVDAGLPARGLSGEAPPRPLPCT